MIINTLAGNYINVGFSDLLRGSIAIDFLCRKYNKTHRISWRSNKSNIHEMFVDYCDGAPYSVAEEQCRLFLCIHQLEEFIRTHDNSTVEYIYCNLNIYTDIHCMVAAPFLRKYTTPSAHLSNLTQNIIDQYNLNDFEVLHFRACDQWTTVLTRHIRMLQSLKHSKKVLFISNKSKIKNIIKQTTNYTVLDIEPMHTGFGTENTDFTGTFIEWNLICKSKRITTISAYDWGSGFTFFPALMYNIPVANITVNNI